MHNHNQLLKMNETLHGYMWAMKSLMRNGGFRLMTFDELASDMSKIDQYINSIYVQFQTHQDGTLTFHIKKKSK